MRDFPEFLGAMAVKELRQGVRGKMFVVPFLGVHVAMLLALGFDFALDEYRGRGLTGLFFATVFGSVGPQMAFWHIAYVLLLIVMPWAGLSSLSREREGGNGELILMAGLSRWKVVIGKWMVLCALGMLTAVTMLPYLLVRYFMGGVNVPFTIALAIALIMLNATANAMAIGISSYPGIVMRIVIGCVAGLGCYFCAAIVCISTAYLGSSVFGIDSALAVVSGGLVGLSATCFLYGAFGLQLGRLRIRPYERPFEPANSSGLVALMIISPLILGFTAAITAGFGATIGALLLAWAVVVMEPNHAQRRAFSSRPPDWERNDAP